MILVKSIIVNNEAESSLAKEGKRNRPMTDRQLTKWAVDRHAAQQPHRSGGGKGSEEGVVGYGVNMGLVLEDKT